ncbi:Protein kinase-like domain protein [Apiospora kogelbergensis]|uniref:Protein kinase-like domain protein n=1 Tax=Apiospora kogelbergensis TaxID=1337665 RepID=A0AAW0R4X8_9PEZI
MSQTDWPVDKIVRFEYLDSARARFLGKDFIRAARREILALAPSRFRGSPNIVQLKGWGLCLDTLEDKSPHPDAIEMSLLVLEGANCDLHAFLQGPYETSNSLLLGLCRDIGSGLAALHDKGFTHGDLKPKNVLIFQTFTGWTAKLCGFGCAWQKVEDDESDYSSPSSPKGQRPRPKYIGTGGWKPPGARVETFVPFSPICCRKATLDAVMKEIRSQFSQVLDLRENGIGESTRAYITPTASQRKSALHDFVTEIHPVAVEHFFDRVRDALLITEQSSPSERAKPSDMLPPIMRERDRRTESSWDIKQPRNSSGFASTLASYLVSPCMPRVRRTGPSRVIYYDPRSHSYTTFPPSVGFSTEPVILIGYIHPGRGAHSVNVANFLPTITQVANLGTTRFPLYTDEWYQQESQHLWPPPKDPLGETQESRSIPSFADRVDHELLPMLTWKILKTTPAVLIVAGLRLIPLLLLLREN